MSNNPYAPPVSDPSFVSGSDELAGRFTRFASAMVDGLCSGALVVPVFFLTGYFQRAQKQEVGLIEELAMSILGMIAFLVVHGYLLATRGQTVGKLLTKIQIVDAQEGKLLPFLKVFVFRYLWLAPVTWIVAIIPGVMDNFVVNILALVDACMIFGAERRCLHDMIAGSKVVLYRDNRSKLTG